MTLNLSNTELKERERQTWTDVAGGWRRRDEILKQGAQPLTERMLALAGIEVGSVVLDIASGTGEPAIPAALRVGSEGRVIGTDLVDEMLTTARDKAAQAGLQNIEFRCVDGETLAFDPASFDAVTIRWGLMFMPEPLACLTQAYEALKSDGRIVVACWAAPERNPFLAFPMQILANYMELPKPPAGAPHIFAFADPERLRRVLVDAGFQEVAVEDMQLNMIDVDSGEAYWHIMQDIAGPIVRLTNQLDEPTRAKFIRELIDKADALKKDNRLCLHGTTLVASGVR